MNATCRQLTDHSRRCVRRLVVVVVDLNCNWAKRDSLCAQDLILGYSPDTNPNL